jgi:hypothetical protein
MKSVSKSSILFRQNGLGELLSKFVTENGSVIRRFNNYAGVKQHNLSHFCCQKTPSVITACRNRVSTNFMQTSYIRPMKIDIMFLVHNFQKLGAGFFHFSLFFVFEFCLSIISLTQ